MNLLISKINTAQLWIIGLILVASHLPLLVFNGCLFVMQIIAGLVEHRLSDNLLSYPNGALLVNMLSFVVRTINSYWGTQVGFVLAVSSIASYFALDK